MDENYIPGFTNELYSSSGMTPYGDYYYDPSMYSDAMVSPYGRMGGDYYEPIDYYDPSIYSEPNYGIDPYGRMAGEQVGMPQAVEPMGGLDIMGGGGSDMTLARPGALYGTSTASPYSKPSLTPSLDFVTNNGQQGYYFVTNAGKRAKTKANPTAFVAVDPNAQYRLVNERGKNSVVASGTGEQGLRDAYAMAQQLSTQGGKKADWYLERMDPNGGWIRIADDDPKGSDLGTFGKILGTALPLAVSLIPGLQFAGPVLSSALAGGAGAALAGGNPLKGAIMGGLTAAGGSVLGPALEGVGMGARAATAVGTGLGATAGGLATGQNLKNSLLGGVTSGGLSYLAPSVLSELGLQPKAPVSGGGTDGGAVVAGGEAPIVVSGLRTPSLSTGLTFDGGGTSRTTTKPAPEPAPEPSSLDEILVTGSRTPSITAPSMSGVSTPINTGGMWGDPYATTPLPSEPLPTDPADLEEILVTARPTTSIGSPISFGNSSPTGTLSDPAYTKPMPEELLPTDEPLDYNEILVTAQPGTSIGSPISFGGSTATGSLSDPAYKNPWPTEQPTQPEENNTLKDIADYLRLAGLASSLLGGLGGSGGGGGQNFNVPTGAGTLSSLFTKQLPTANIPTGAGAAARSAADLGNQGLRDMKDYYRYGYGPQQSFFNYVPQGAPNTSQAFTGYAEGGLSMVEGEGDGRDDKIPALLSDGEYVVDAETVALLGNGSNKAGAEMLDKFRVNLRKQKGRKLARGEFSADAKRPENYMAGRLA